MSTDLKILSSQFLAERERIMAFIAMLVHDPDAAEDIFQEVWIKLAEAAQNGVAVENVAQWCRGVSKNLILHHWRARKNQAFTPDDRIIDLAALAYEEDESSQSQRRHESEALAACIATLPENSRLLLKLKFVDGKSLTEIGARANKSYDSVRIALSRVRQALEECVRKRLALAATGISGRTGVRP